MAIWLRRGIIIFLGSWLVWRILASGMAEFYADKIGQDTNAAAAALAWYPEHPRALRSIAEQFGDPNKAEAKLAFAYAGDPTDGLTLLQLANLWREQGDTERADKACELAERLFPTDPQLHLSASQYWAEAGNPQKMLTNLDLVMRIKPGLAPSFFPLLLDVTEDPVDLSSLSSIAASVPSWWQGFFVYAAQNIAHVDTLYSLYSLHKQPSPQESNAYQARLLREGFWWEAYMDWINSLNLEQQQALGYLFDGGFELTEFSGGFDWDATRSNSVKVITNYTQLVTGKKALHIIFKGGNLPPFIVEQKVFLLPGHYQFSGRVRPDALQAVAGLEWRLECVSETEGMLATSERFLGSDTWRRFTVDFNVKNEACSGVRIKLQPVGYQSVEREIKGEIWFDDLVIALAEEMIEEKPQSPSPASKMKSLTGKGRSKPTIPSPRT